jgi:hypothetical protein
MCPPPFVHNVALADLAETWLEVRGCKGITYLPVHLMAAGRPSNARLRDVLARLRCAKCRSRPSMLALVENPAGGGMAARRQGGGSTRS